MTKDNTTAARSLVRAADKLRKKPNPGQERKVETATKLFENSKKGK